MPAANVSIIFKVTETYNQQVPSYFLHLDISNNASICMFHFYRRKAMNFKNTHACVFVNMHVCRRTNHAHANIHPHSKPPTSISNVKAPHRYHIVYLAISNYQQNMVLPTTLFHNSHSHFNNRSK